MILCGKRLFKTKYVTNFYLNSSQVCSDMIYIIRFSDSYKIDNSVLVEMHRILAERLSPN